MPDTIESKKVKQEALQTAIESGAFEQLQQMLVDIPAVDMAHFIESSPPQARSLLWRLIPQKDESEILQYLSEEVRSEHLSTLDDESIANLVVDLDNDDIADLLQDLPSRVTELVLESLDGQRRTRLEAVLQYHEDTAGGLMNTDTITIRPNITLDVVFRYLRAHGSIPKATDNLFVVDRKNILVGTLRIADLLVNDLDQSVRKTMCTDINAIDANCTAHEVAQLFAQRDLITAPVVNEFGELVGRITVDDVVDVIREEADHSIMSMAGLDEEDTFAPLLKTAQGRAVWLGVNLLTAVLASVVIGLFQETLTQVIALAVLMPIVASMGGVAGSQTLTLVIRSIALGHINTANQRWIIRRELGVALLNGLLWATVMGVITSFWFNASIALIIGAAMIINLATAALSGACIPLLLRKVGVDPALAGGVILTTITDVVGFLAFLGLATMFFT